MSNRNGMECNSTAVNNRAINCYFCATVNNYPIATVCLSPVSLININISLASPVCQHRRDNILNSAASGSFTSSTALLTGNKQFTASTRAPLTKLLRFVLLTQLKHKLYYLSKSSNEKYCSNYKICVNYFPV